MRTVNIKDCKCGNTFDAVVVEAFELNSFKDFSEVATYSRSFDGSPYVGGTIEVKGVDYDWTRSGDLFNFFLAE